MVGRMIQMMLRPLAISRQGIWTLGLPNNPFISKNTPIFTWICWVWKFPNMYTSGRKAGSFLTPPTPTSLSLHLHWRQDERNVIWSQKQGEFTWIAYFNPKMSQNTHLLLCHHSYCSYKHETINWKSGQNWKCSCHVETFHDHTTNLRQLWFFV